MAKSEIFNTDCIEYMRTLPDNYFDIAVCDPPFGSANDDALIGGGQNASTKEEYSRDTTTPRWNRLKGGRRERYYTPVEQVSGGGKLSKRTKQVPL